MSYKKNNIPNNVVLDSSILPQTNTLLSTFNLSEQHITTIPVDTLIPVYQEELNPNDHFEIKISELSRFMPMAAPTMSNLKVKFFAFFVPNRLIWKNWTKFMGEVLFQSDAKNVYRVPQLQINQSGVQVGSIFDYMGVPPLKQLEVGALPFRAYRKIWNDWFRANLIQEPEVEYDGDSDGSDITERDSYHLARVGKALDYFTSCLPSPQAGNGVYVKLLDKAPVMADPKTGCKIPTLVEGQNYYGYNAKGGLMSKDTQSHELFQGNEKLVRITQPHNTEMYADMSKVSGISINSLRELAALQVFLENDNKAGRLYVDLMSEHFGVDVPDWLVGRSQYLGSVTHTMRQEPLAQTSENGITPLGTLAAQAFSNGYDKICEFSAVEHGQLMILACVKGDVLYQQGISRKLTKKDRLDYMFPEFWNLGDQAVLNKEIYVSGDPVVDEQVFGYQGRYREYREGTNRVSGLMRSGIPGTLDVWHLGESFNATPKLSKDFIASNTPIRRVLASSDNNHLLMSIYFDIKATRSLPVTPTPSILAGRI